MTAKLSPMRLTGARILRDGQLQNRSIAISNGRIVREPLPAIDMRGFLILPGVIDLMSDTLAGPCGGPRTDWTIGQLARRAAANGTTRLYMCQGWSWETPAASPASAECMGQALQRHKDLCPIDIRMMLRVEHDLSPDLDRILSTVRENKVDLVLFSNRAARARTLMDRSPAEFSALARTLDMSPDALRVTLDSLGGATPSVPRALCALAEQFDTQGVIYGSLEDDSGEAREHHSMIGAGVCVAPRSRQAAAAARAVSDPVVWSAVDVVEQLRTQALTKAAVAGIDAIVSANGSVSLADLALHLEAAGLATLPQAWALVSERPARLLRLTDHGRLDPGCQADLTIVNAATRQVEATITAGKLAFLSGEAAIRFMDARTDQAIAAE